MHIKVIIPVSTDKWDRGVKAEYDQVKDPRTLLDIVHLARGPEAIQSEYDEARAAPWVLEEVLHCQKQPLSGIIIYCFSDPGLYAAREISTIPVVGIGESAQILAMGIADRIGIVTTLEQSVPRIRRKLSTRGISTRFPSIRALNIPVLEYDEKEKVLERALDLIRLMVKEDGVEALVLGCGALLGMEKKIQETFQVPVVEPGKAALKHAEMLCALGLSHSKKSYMVPMPVRMMEKI